MLSSSAVSNMNPSKLSFGIVSVFRPPAPQPVVEDGPKDLTLGSAKPMVQNLTKHMQDMGLKLVGEIWGLRLSVGE